MRKKDNYLELEEEQAQSNFCTCFASLVIVSRDVAARLQIIVVVVVVVVVAAKAAAVK